MATPISILLQEPTKTESFHQPRPVNSSTRGRKPSKCPPRKKHPPQRGMGVAQLERLRLQEWRKTMIEANQMDSLSHLQLPVDDPLKVNRIPVQYGSVISNGSGGFGVGHQFFANPYLVGAPVQLGLSSSNSASAVFETSKELSSMPKIITQQCAHTRCDLCFKGMEVAAVHRKGNSANGRVIVEYEFFPGKSGDHKSTCSKDMEASVAVGTNASNFVDLSLKLSF
ncbi:hypothetical protein K2173_003084 [Erythroxylum novogranatense]|uniref:Uncharacterized protein n=1 Tax=Erythroxylum novogranatense TaxID=1862640 RepID=A0AAV8T9X8_9ROSI|nr:hypothetical protein K2173_003084 [Erythroxylum novogranatense]